MKRAILSALVLLPVTGCTYMEQRWNDYTDVTTASFSIGAEIGVKFGELAHIGMGGSISTPFSPAFPIPIPFLYQMMYGNMPDNTELWWPVSLWLAGDENIPMGLHTVNYRSFYPRGPVPDREVRELNPALNQYVGIPPEHMCWMFGPFAFHNDPVPTMFKDYFNLELSFVFLICGKVRFLEKLVISILEMPPECLIINFHCVTVTFKVPPDTGHQAR